MAKVLFISNHPVPLRHLHSLNGGGIRLLFLGYSGMYFVVCAAVAFLCRLRVTRACSDERLPAAYDGKIYCSVGIDPDNVFLWCRYVVMMVTTKTTRGLLGLISYIHNIYLELGEILCNWCGINCIFSRSLLCFFMMSGRVLQLYAELSRKTQCDAVVVALGFE